MKTRFFLICLVAFAFRASAWGQSASIDWYCISGGGGTSTNGQYSITGTIGQPDAGGAMAGGNYSLTGGFWSLICVMQTPGMPNLIILSGSQNSVIILWPDPATNTYALQQNSNLAGGHWAASGCPVTSANSTNSITITSPSGPLFFRLMNAY
jgi:hypothetical protein